MDRRVIVSPLPGNEDLIPGVQEEIVGSLDQPEMDYNTYPNPINRSNIHGISVTSYRPPRPRVEGSKSRVKTVIIEPGTAANGEDDEPPALLPEPPAAGLQRKIVYVVKGQGGATKPPVIVRLPASQGNQVAGGHSPEKRPKLIQYTVSPEMLRSGSGLQTSGAPEMDEEPEDQQETTVAPDSFKCETCGADFGDGFQNLRLHQIKTGHGKIFAAGRQFRCSICLTNFEEGASLARHYRMAHGRAANCPHCGIRFHKMEELSLHVLQFHLRAKPPHPSVAEEEGEEGPQARKPMKQKKQKAEGSKQANIPEPVPAEFELVPVGSGYLKKESKEAMPAMESGETEKKKKKWEVEAAEEGVDILWKEVEAAAAAGIGNTPRGGRKKKQEKMTLTPGIEGLEQEAKEEEEEMGMEGEEREVEVNFCCTACKQGYRTKAQLKDQGITEAEKSELGGKTRHSSEQLTFIYQCSSCKLFFKHFMAWRLHVAVSHKTERQEFKCPTCGEIQYDAGMLEWHSASVHKEEEKGRRKKRRPVKRGRKPSKREEEVEGEEEDLAEEAEREETPIRRRRRRTAATKQRLLSTRRNAATTKLPGRNSKEDAPPLEKLTPHFMHSIKTVDQKRHFRQAHSERILQEALVKVLEKLNEKGATNIRECLILMEVFQDFWRIFYPEQYEEVLEKIKHFPCPDYAIPYPPLSSIIADSYTHSGMTKELVPPNDPVMLFGRFIVNPKRRKARSNFACRKFPGTDFDSPSLDKLSSDHIKPLGYDQIRRFRRAHGEVFLYELLRSLPRLTEKQQEVLLNHFWRYWWVFYPSELQLLSLSTSSESQPGTSGVRLTYQVKKATGKADMEAGAASPSNSP